MTLRYVSFCLLLFALCLADNARAAGEHPLFQDDEVLKAVLLAPIGQVYAQRHQDVRIYFPGYWSYLDGDGKTQRLDVSIRARGHFRREFCELVPLQLNFKKSQVKGTLFQGQDKLKLVAPCKDGDRYQQYVILEYLAYRTFEIITDYSFRTRLVRLSYVDTDEKNEPWTDIAFIIEDDSDMATRLGLERLGIASVKYNELDHPKTALVQLFQFLIANNDYSVIKGAEGEDCCHNAEVLAEEASGGTRIPIPFDFDLSGLVNANYAKPPNPVPIVDVRDRYFYGLCQPRGTFDNAIMHLQSKRDEIIALFVNSAELNAKGKKNSIRYIEEFYDILDSPEQFEREIIDRCRGNSLMEKMIESSKDSSSDRQDPL